jgi:cell division septation protein DedD
MTGQGNGKRCGLWRIAMIGAGALLVSGCDETGQFNNPFAPGQTTREDTVATDSTSVKLIERDVEAPDVFQVTDMGLWDGRPSLGGVWVAHPDVKEPERVIIRNNENSKFVIGASFRRERENPGPVLQVSSDAATALGMLAGAPAQLNVTALRREEAPDPAASSAPEGELDAPDAVEETTLDPVDPVAGAAAALDEVESTTDIQPAATAPKPAARPQTAASSLEKPYIQIGIFSVESNARNTATAMRQAGMVPVVKEQSSQGKKFWRVIVGPAASKSERSVLLKKIKGVGFDDAYPVTN